MSLNAYFTYSVCLGMHVPWRTALGVIFFSGVLFLVLTVSGFASRSSTECPNA